jgi:hypothetical protein
MATATVEETLNIVADAYAAKFQEKVLPFIFQMASVDPHPVNVVAEAQLVNGNIAITLGLEYDGAYPDPYELVNRMIVAEFFNRMVAQLGK